MNRQLSSLINNDLSKNIAISGFFSNYPVEEYYIEGDSAIIFGRSDHLWMHIASTSETELSVLLEKYSDKTEYYFSVEDWMIPFILKYGTEDWIMTTNRYILNDEINIDLPVNEIVSLDRSFATYIYENSDYKSMNSPEYFDDRLSKDVSCGIFKDNKLAAWGFTHDDGALGSVHVLKKYRRKGYAKDILSGLIRMRRKEQKPVFGNVVPENTASVNMLTQIGFILDCKVSWIKLIRF